MYYGYFMSYHLQPNKALKVLRCGYDCYKIKCSCREYVEYVLLAEKLEL